VAVNALEGGGKGVNTIKTLPIEKDGGGGHDPSTPSSCGGAVPGHRQEVFKSGDDSIFASWSQ